jgi:hypothetical protein
MIYQMNLIEATAAIVSFTLGMIGITTETKDHQTGRLTRWGKVDLSCFVAAAILTLLQHVRAKIDDDAREYARSAETTNAILRESSQIRKLRETFNQVRRVAEPIPHEFAVGIGLNVSCDQLRGGLSDALCSDKTGFHTIKMLPLSLMSEFKRLLSDSGPGGMSIELFNRAPVDDDYNHVATNLSIGVNLVPTDDELRDVSYIALYSKKDRHVEIAGSLNAKSATVLYASPEITSLRDLPGMTGLVSFSGNCGGSFREDMGGFPCVPDSITLVAPGGQRVTIHNFRPLKRGQDGFVGNVE